MAETRTYVGQGPSTGLARLVMDWAAVMSGHALSATQARSSISRPRQAPSHHRIEPILGSRMAWPPLRPRLRTRVWGRSTCWLAREPP